MFCRNCGKEVEEDWSVCPNCGYEIRKKQENTEEIVQENREYNLLGMRRTGRFSFWKIPTAIKVEGDNIDIITQGKKTVENRFKKQDIAGIDFPILPIWKISDIIRLIVFGALLLVTKGLSIFAVLVSIKIAVSRHLRMKLNTGRVISIPICQKADASGFLRELNYPENEIAKNDAERVSDKKWVNREWVICMLLFSIAAGTMAIGLSNVANNLQNEEVIDYLGEEESDSSSEEDYAKYLSNDSEALPVQINNVYKTDDYYFTTFDFDMSNICGVDIEEAVFGMVAWDSNGLPLQMNSMYGLEDTYFYRFNGSNIAAGQITQGSISFELEDFKYIQILLLEYTDFEGNTWTNPIASYYEENYAGEKFDQNTMSALVFE